MNRGARTFFAIAFLSVAGCGPLIARAQSLPQGVSIGSTPPPVQYTLTPDVPGPNQKVTIQVEGVGDFIGNSPIIWTLNGKAAASGTGDNSFLFTTGPLGQKTTVGVAIESADYGTITNTWNFNPSLVNLVWEADTMVPPLYMGHALYSLGSGLTVFAFPEVLVGGKRVPDSQLSFQWQLEGNAQVNSSGLGRDSFSFQGDELQQSEDVSVDILSGGTAVAHGDITILPSNPLLVFYDHDPLRGILYGTALPSTFTMSGSEMTLHAEPYFFSRSSAGNALSWNWTLNSNPTTGPNAAAGELTLRSSGAGTGSAVVTASVQNTGVTSFLQGAQSSMTLNFGSTQNGSIFGI